MQLGRVKRQPLTECTEATVSLQYQRQKLRDFYIPEICWRCDAPMKIKTIRPSMTFPLLDEVVYRCPACHIERKQTVLKDDNVQRGDLN